MVGGPPKNIVSYSPVQIGDIVHTRILGDDVVVISSETKLKLLTEGHRSAVYASRLQFHLFKRCVPSVL